MTIGLLILFTVVLFLIVGVLCIIKAANRSHEIDEIMSIKSLTEYEKEALIEMKKKRWSDEDHAKMISSSIEHVGGNKKWKL